MPRRVSLNHTVTDACDLTAKLPKEIFCLGGMNNGCTRSLLHRCEILSLWRLEPRAACVQQDRSVWTTTLALRQVCELVERITDLLPNSVVSDLLTSLRARRRTSKI